MYIIPLCSVECRALFGRGANSPMFRPESIGDPLKRLGRGEWKRRAAEARSRDSNTCRRCARKWEHGRCFPVDHVIPWRTFENKAHADDLSNLVTLCDKCHSWKTSTAERKWFMGDMQSFAQFKRDIGVSVERTA